MVGRFDVEIRADDDGGLDDVAPLRFWIFS
jgi:hypothetical protein